MTWIRWGVREFANFQFGLFLVVGATAAICNWVARVWFSTWLSFVLAVCIAYGVGLVVAFFLNCWLVFPQSAKPWSHKAGYFLLWNLFTFPLVVAISWLLRWHVLPAIGIERWVEGIAHALGLAFPTFLSFMVHKYFTFGRQRSRVAPAETG